MEITGYAMVTGGGQGVGRGLAIAFAREGAAGISIASRTLSYAQETVEECNAAATNPQFRAIAIQVDIADEEQVASMVKQHVDAFGRLDYAVNCAGQYVETPYDISDLPIKEFENFYNTNIRGTLLCVQAEIRQMKNQEPLARVSGNLCRKMQKGSIVNISAVNSIIAMPNLTPYTISKHAMTGLTKNAALDAAKHNIRVNAVSPTWVATDKVREFLEGIPELHESVIRQHPLGRIAEVEEVADVVLFLSSPRANYITGANWEVDGAMTYSRT